MFFLSAFFFFCRHVFLLCLFLGVSLIFSRSDLLSDGNPFACPVSLSTLCLFHGFSAFCAFFICDFSLFKFFCMDFSSWFRFLDSDFFTWRIIFFSSCSSLLFLSCASFPVRGFSAFGIFPKDLLFFLFRVRLYSFLIPHVNAFFLLMLTCGLIGLVVGAYRDSFFRNLYKRRCAHLFILPAKGTGKCPYRRSDSHALSDSLKSRMPIVRRTRTLYCLVVYLFSKFVFGFFET